MAIYRKINTNFWSDPFICDLHPEKKLFYLYILTNERTKQCGIYDISKRQICFDLGIDINTVTENINFFTSANKIMFSELTNEIAIKNWERFNGSTSPKVVTCVQSELKLVKNKLLIDYIYSINTVSQETPTETPTETQAPIQKEIIQDVPDLKNPIPPELKIDYDKLKLFFNDNRGEMAKVQILSDKRKKAISALIKKFSKEDFMKVIDKSKVSNFLQGRNDRNWTADFDWILNQTNFIKILEGNFDNKTTSKQLQNNSGNLIHTND